MTEELNEIYSLSAKKDCLINFFNTFKDSNGGYKYRVRIDQAISRNSILINTIDLFDTKILMDWLISEPQEFLKAASESASEIFKFRYQKEKEFEIYLDEAYEKISVVEALGDRYIGKLITLSGIITSSTGLYNELEYRIFVCPDNHETKIERKITKCPECTKPIKEITPKEKFKQHRMLYLRTDDDFGYHGDELRLDTCGDLTNIADSGDRVTITGIVITKEMRQTGNFQNIILCNNIKKLDDVDHFISQEDEEVFKKYPEKPDFYQRCINSIAPSIEGYGNVKESILLQLVGSPNVQKNDGTKVRGWMHLGLFGDAGTAKTKFAEWVCESQIPRRAQLVMSKGATETGLTIGLEDGPDGRKVLRAGAMVNCRDGGIVCIDEFPRLKPEIIDALFTTSENGIASSAKTGNQSKIRADASMILTGNAHTGRWNDPLSVQDNLAVDGNFLTRLDFIWIFIDIYNKERDRKIAESMIYDTSFSDIETSPFTQKTLAKYIKFCRRINPELRNEEGAIIIKAYTQMRDDPKARDNGINPRHLDTLKRIVLAGARLHQRRYTEPIDATRAIELFREMMKQHNISISQADTYVQRNFNKGLKILQTEPTTGLRASELLEKILLQGTQQEQDQALVDLGTNKEVEHNWKFREVLEELKRSHLILIVSRKPLILAYNHNKADISKW